MISGVQLKRLIKHADERGYFMELIRARDPFFDGFGQWSETIAYQGVIKAWHIHQQQTDYWRVPFGVIKAVLCDRRGDSGTYNQISEYILGDCQEAVILKIPPGVAHGYKVLQGPAILIYITNQIYNPDDEGRISYDDAAIGYDWLGEDIR